MKLIESSYEIIPQESGLEGIFKQIEIGARVCYKSENLIKDGSAEKMVDALIKRGHGSPLEHGTIYLKGKLELDEYGNPFSEWCPLCKYEHNPYSKYHNDGEYVYVTTNYRVIIENGWLDDLKYLCEPTEFHEKRYTVRMKCSIGVAREFNRHRVNSPCEQSTRYCNYSLDKFGNEITFVIPQWVIDRTDDYSESYDAITGMRNNYLAEMPVVDAVSRHMVCLDRAINVWAESLKKAELDYLYLLSDECNLKPQDARGVLPLDTATELIHTAFASDWEHFFKLRTSPGAHPDAIAIACPLEANFKLKGFI